MPIDFHSKQIPLFDETLWIYYTYEGKQTVMKQSEALLKGNTPCASSFCPIPIADFIIFMIL